jgi:outer membrane beta-barrel protein
MRPSIQSDITLHPFVASSPRHCGVPEVRLLHRTRACKPRSARQQSLVPRIRRSLVCFVLTLCMRTTYVVRYGALVVIMGCILLLNSAAQAKTGEDLEYGNVYAIQKRTYAMKQEFSLSVAFLPLDAFYKYFGIAGHYVLHFNNLWAWEAVHFTFTEYLDIDTGLKSSLNKWSATPTRTPILDMMLDSNLMIKPLYGKIALINNFVVYAETYFLAGVGAQKYKTAWFPDFDIGIGMRVFLNNKFSLRVEAREYMYIENKSVSSTIYLGVSFCYNAFADEEQTKKAEPVTGVVP